MHTMYVLLYALLVYASYYFLSLQIFNLIQIFFHFHTTKMRATKSEQGFVQTFSGIKCRQIHMIPTHRKQLRTLTQVSKTDY